MSAADRSAFAALGLRNAISGLLEEIRTIYRDDAIPWVVGYSGGKDSTATLQLVWMAVTGMAPAHRSKPVYVISTDTLVENPVVAAWVNRSLEIIHDAARTHGLPIEPHRLTPAIQDTYWVNLIGRGYAAPRHKFRWCTERLKINPSNRFIHEVVRANGEVILVLGTRKAESALRAHAMTRQEGKRIRAGLSPNERLPGSLVYTPIEHWSNDDVWLFLMQYRNPWGVDNKDLLSMYRGASADGECPLVIDTSTPSCGSSRFGCWVCTMVDEDRSMAAMIQNDEEKEWMLPLLELRNELGQRDDRHRRDFRRLSGRVQLFHDRPIPGPYKQSVREYWLRRVLEVEAWLRAHGPDEVRDIELISMAELAEIRRIWVMDKHEIEDRLPRIYEEVRGEPFAGRFDDSQVFGAAALTVLREVCGDDELHYELARELLDIEWRARTKLRRAGLFDALEQAFQRSFFANESDAVEHARRRRDALARDMLDDDTTSDDS